AGGSSLNCVSNGKLLESEFVKEIYVQPASSDSGTAIGAAYLEWIKLSGKPSNFKMEHAYWGPEFTNEQILEELKKTKLKYRYYKDISGTVAELINKGKIIGWFQGRMEIGPRALGNRSILANPTDRKMKDKVNLQVKHRECYDEKTEILTQGGWKKFKDISDNEIVATLNPKNNKLGYQKILKKVKYKYNGKMVRFKNKRIDLLVTPNHRIWAKKIFNHQKDSSYPRYFEFRNAIDLLRKEHLQIKAIEKWKGIEEKYFVLPKIKIEKYSHLSQIHKIPMDLWLEFLGYYLSEGCVCYDKGHHTILISQGKKSRHLGKIQNCLNKLPYKWHYNVKSFRTSNKQLYGYLKQFGKCEGKFIPRELLDLSERQLTILFEALMCGDGYKRGKQCKYYTTSKELAENVQEICLKLGYSIYTSKEIRAPKRKNLYVIRANKGSKTSWVRKNQSNIEDYSGYVYCVSVPKYHILCVKRNEKVVFSGNSWRPFAPSALLEVADEYFENARHDPFMILSFNVKKEKQKDIPAVVHVDGTTRPQTVRKKDNERYYKLIKDFGDITGIPVVLNTSFNDKEEPLVCSPLDAINCFKRTNLDYLAIGNYLVEN
ncbi:MAG TPA: carbamoyltransferase C-terminal domain-containing protein, partial [Candidatus Nanoarchaeia archaeon]|nr:carbamoyltransferase C-terminal domain-containing protein [Candidatus Nanoarchaeia archaeon]